jgi:hypothetical protein
MQSHTPRSAEQGILVGKQRKVREICYTSIKFLSEDPLKYL